MLESERLRIFIKIEVLDRPPIRRSSLEERSAEDDGQLDDLFSDTRVRPRPLATHHGLKAWTTVFIAPFRRGRKTPQHQQWPGVASDENNRRLLKGSSPRLEGLLNESKRPWLCHSGYCGMGCPVGETNMEPTYLTDIKQWSDLDHRLLGQKTGPKRNRNHGGSGSNSARGERGDETLSGSCSSQAVCCGGRFLKQPCPSARQRHRFPWPSWAKDLSTPSDWCWWSLRGSVQGFYGAPQSLTSHQFAATKDGKMGFFFETAPVHPALSASVFAAFGSDLSQIMSSLDRTGVLIALHIDGFLPEDEGGTVRLVDGRPSLHYPVRPALKSAFQESHKKLAELTLAAGAYEAFSMHLHPERIRSKTDISGLDQRAYGAFEHPIFSAHQMGGCAMGPDPATSVVDEQLKIHGLTNAYVVDGSVLPTSLGVNPSQTIYGIAHRASEWISSI